MTAVSERPRRRTQAERSAATRGLLLDATVDCLVEFGYAGTSTTLIAERAGVSRGAQVHHFPSKSTLVADAVEHLADRRIEELRREADKLPSGRGRSRAALDLLWTAHSGPLFEAATELLLAARTDRGLRETLIPIEARLSLAVLEVCREVFGEEIGSTPKFPGLVTMTLNTMMGLGLQRVWSEPREVERMWAFSRERLVRLFEAER